MNNEQIQHLHKFMRDFKRFMRDNHYDIDDKDIQWYLRGLVQFNVNELKERIMDYEKKYEKLVDAVKVLRDNNPFDEGIQGWVNNNVPELKESEDEKIRKEIIVYLSTVDDKELIPYESWIAWLEKQKPTTDIQNLTWEDIEKIGEIINIVQYENPNGIGAKCLYTDVLERFLDGKQTKQKPTWSEDDELHLEDAIHAAKELYSPNCGGDELVDWLKSLKERVQPQWKPSSQYIAALEYQVNSTYQGSWQYKASKELLEQLKKL